MLINVFTLLIVLYPILSAYSIVGPIDLGVAVSSITAGLIFAVKGNRIKTKWPKGWKAFLIYVFLAAIIVSHAFPARIILYSFLLIMGCSFCNINLLYKYYKTTAIICILFFLFQEFFNIIFSIKISGIFTFLPTIYGDSAAYIANNILQSQRSSSFFLEPSYYAQFLFPIIVLELFWRQDKYHLRNAVLFSLCMVLIRSGNGMILLALIWSCWLYFSNIKKKTKRYILIGGGLTFVVLVMVYPSMVYDLMNRSSELSFSGVNNRWQSSGFIRFWRGYFLYASFPIVNKIFGMNPVLIKHYMINNSMGLFDQDIDTVFINGIQTILCFYGAIGLFFVLRHLYLLGRQSSLIVKVLLVCTLYLLLSESYFISSRMMVVIILTYLIKTYENESSVHY